MVQDLGLEDVGTIRTMAHWDSKKDLTGRAQRGWYDICSLSTHFSAALPKPQAGIRFPPYLYHGSLTNCVKNGPWLALGTRRLYFFLHILRITGRCVELVGTSAMVPKPFEPYLSIVWKRGLVF